MGARSAAMLLVVCIAATGCMDKTRVNDTCTWSDGEARSLDLSRAPDRDHLRVDVKVAGELALRFGDVRYRNRPDMAMPLRERCATALFDTIMRRHGVTRLAIDVATRARIWWADILLVFLPMALLLGAAMDAITRRVCRSYEADDRAIATISVVLLTPAVALIGLGVTQFWAFSVEAWLLRDGHVSFRASQIPAVAHGWITYFAALALCVVIAALRFRVTPLTGSNDMFAARRARRPRVVSRDASPG